jgi:thioredoxin reductase (NADPH)
MTQARRFGMELMAPRLVTEIDNVNGYKKIHFDNGESIATHSVIIATGVDYRKHEAQGIDRFLGAGVYYGAALTEAMTCRDGDVYIAGGGNSAGQTAMYLSRIARHIYVVVRKGELSSNMSAYLIERILSTPNISIVPNSIVTGVDGSDRLEQVQIARENGEHPETHPACAFFIFIGARPYTNWIDAAILKDERGFVATGASVQKMPSFQNSWPLKRDPYTLETSLPGVFAAGDVRSGAMNRVASAVGEGAMAISLVHRYLAEIK